MQKIIRAKVEKKKSYTKTATEEEKYRRSIKASLTMGVITAMIIVGAVISELIRSI